MRPLNFYEQRGVSPREALFVKNCPNPSLYTSSAISSLAVLDPVLRPKGAL
jgi:hypothetical protein